MHRIYESSALHRNDDDPFAPNERDPSVEPQAIRSLDGDLLSRHLVPYWLRYRAIDVDVSTAREEYPPGSTVEFQVTLQNRFPIPVTVPTTSRIPWTWSVDELTEASHVSQSHAPDERQGFRFGRGECKRFTRRWKQMFRVSPSEWERAEPGEYTIRAGINAEDAVGKGVIDETIVRVLPE